MTQSTNEVEKNIKQGVYTTKTKQGKSDIWKQFSVVCDKEGKELDFMSDKCEKVLVYSGHKSGTSGLRRHTCSVVPGQSKLLFKSKQLLPTHIKQETAEKCMDVCCLDIRPYDLVAGKGFSDILQHFVNVAAKYGKFDVNDILPHPTTVSRHVEGRAQALRASVAAEIKPIIETYGCAITTDIWTEDYHKCSFISGTIHYTNNNFDLISRVLFAAPFETGVSKTGENIRILLFQKLCEFGIDTSLLSDRVVFVTDRGANIVAALRGYNRLNCNAHILNVTLSSAFAPAVLAETTELSELLSNAKKLVKYFKHSGLQNSLKKSLKQSIETRWNSNYDMLDSILQQHEEIATLLLSNDQYERIAQINANTLRTVVAFLKLFKDATNDLESSTIPSASLPLPWSVTLIEHCQAASLEPLLSEVSNVCASRLEELMGTSDTSAFPLHMMYRIATLLTPKMRLLRMLPLDARDDVVKGAKEIIQKMKFDLVTATAVDEPSAKKQSTDRFADWEDDASFVTPNTLVDEMAEYLSSRLPDNPDPDSVLEWWKFNKERY
ncbi:hypothetical protein ACEWY4_013914 [Coilia grayii]|uniref:Hermes trasposase DNA-binding domain-containing protein n=1 Tax=Coilia grayii TaxID=363190 RepID=A0ABD1JXT9_9TELE